MKSIVDDKQIARMKHGDIMEQIAAHRGVSVDEARKILPQLSFSQYMEITEAGIVPPSGNPVGSQQPTKPPGVPPKPKWPGNGAPVEKGMMVDVPDDKGVPSPGEVVQVDASAKGIKVKNPITGQLEWQNLDSLTANQSTQVTEHDRDLSRLRTLAGIGESMTSGATGAGSIAVSPVSVGKMQTRETALKKEYTSKGPAQTIIGDTKPSQASGELSANLAASGKKTASRTNNGFRK